MKPFMQRLSDCLCSRNVGKGETHVCVEHHFVTRGVLAFATKINTVILESAAAKDCLCTPGLAQQGHVVIVVEFPAVHWITPPTMKS